MRASKNPARPFLLPTIIAITEATTLPNKPLQCQDINFGKVNHQEISALLAGDLHLYADEMREEEDYKKTYIHFSTENTPYQISASKGNPPPQPYILTIHEALLLYSDDKKSSSDLQKWLKEITSPGKCKLHLYLVDITNNGILLKPCPSDLSQLPKHEISLEISDKDQALLYAQQLLSAIHQKLVDKHSVLFFKDMRYSNTNALEVLTEDINNSTIPVKKIVLVNPELINDNLLRILATVLEKNHTVTEIENLDKVPANSDERKPLLTKINAIMQRNQQHIAATAMAATLVGSHRTKHSTKDSMIAVSQDILKFAEIETKDKVHFNKLKSGMNKLPDTKFFRNQVDEPANSPPKNPEGNKSKPK